MDAKYKIKWLEALRSGLYTQGKGYLKVPEQYAGARAQGSPAGSMCCLGVLVAACPELPTGEPDHAGYLSPQVREQVGLPLDMQENLTRLNDEQSLSFAEIADWIEANL